MNELVYDVASKRTWRDRLGRVRQLALSRPALLVFACVIFSLVMLWPLPLHAGSAVQDLGDPLYQIWTLRWVQHQILTNPLHLWDANTGYPFSDSLLFSEPLISTSLIAWPLQIISHNDILTYNVLFIGTYVLAALGMALFIWEITEEFGASILAGFVTAFVPYRYGHLSHLNLLSYGWGLLALWSLVRFARRRRATDAVLAGVLLAVQFLASDTLGLMMSLVVGLGTLILLWRERRRLSAKLIVGIAFTFGLAALVELPVALARFRVDRMYGFTRDLATIQKMSATLQTYVSVHPRNQLWSTIHLLPASYPNPLFPGMIASLAAIIGLMLGFRRWPNWTFLGTVTALIGFTLSLGPFMVLGGHTYHLPYYALYRFVPGFTAMRDAARFGMVALIGVQMLAGIGFAASWKAIRPRLPESRVAFVGPTIVMLLLVGATIEYRTQVGTVAVPKDDATMAAYRWLAQQPKGPVIDFPANGLWKNVLWPISDIYYSTYDWDPITAAYASYVPQRDVDLMVAINGGPTNPSQVTPDNVGMLQDLGIRYVLIHHWPNYDWQAAVDEASKVGALKLEGNFGDTSVYTLAPGNRSEVTYSVDAPEQAYAEQTLYRRHRGEQRQRD